MATLLSVLLLGIVGAYYAVGLGFLSKENALKLRDAAQTTIRWMWFEVDPLGQPHDGSSDIEAGVGDTGQTRPMNNQHLLLPSPVVRPSRGGAIHRRVGDAGQTRPMNDQHLLLPSPVVRPSRGGAIHRSPPLYDWENNMLSRARGPILGGQRGRRESPHLLPSPAPKAAEEHVRNGRDMTSSDALGGNLDLAFEDITLTKLIGGGGFGQVHEGVWRGKPVAVKVLVPGAQRDLDDAVGTNFIAEVMMLSALRQPNVCLFLAACITPPKRAIVTELVRRGSLWEVLRSDYLPAVTLGMDASGSPRDGRGRVQQSPFARFSSPAGCWPWPAIMKVVEGVACGMAYLHRQKPFPVIHRDLKSANILLDDEFNVKICDFGLARLKACTNMMTGNCGTVQWMAPEVLANQTYTETVDVYSFGVVCWELLSRACPYQGMDQIQVAIRVLNNGLRPSIPQWCTHEFRSLIENSWQQEAAKRPSFGEILRKLRSSVPDSLLNVV